MLSLLHIENIALIETADIRFIDGFNALTGETGAGKSIVIDSISAVLGERTSRDLIRTGAKSAFVSAVFCELPHLEWFDQNGITPDDNGELILERDIQADGRNACRINGRPTTVAQLKSLGRLLLNIHGQHDGQQLLDEGMHLQYLDRYGVPIEIHEAYSNAYAEILSVKHEIESLEMDEAEKSRRIDLLTYQINELERAKLKPGEDEELHAKKTVFRNAGKLVESLDEVEYALSGGGDAQGALDLIIAAADALATASRLVPETSEQGAVLNELAEKMHQIRFDVYDIQESSRDIRESMDISVEDIDQMESRLDLLYRLGKKYGPSVAEMISYQEKCKAELEQIQSSNDRIEFLKRRLKSLLEIAVDAGRKLTNARKAAAESLQLRIQNELFDLDMPKVRFVVQIEPKECELGMDSSGMDQVCFLMSANVGEELKPINKIASGGELSRIMLALKNVLAEADDVCSLVFDEVDTGVSGRAAAKVARKMAQVAKQKQILCVTHLPQIASMADLHLFVEKGERGGRTFTIVRELDREARALELSRLTGGETITEAMVESARELLLESEEYRKTL